MSVRCECGTEVPTPGAIGSYYRACPGCRELESKPRGRVDRRRVADVEAASLRGLGEAVKRAPKVWLPTARPLVRCRCGVRVLDTDEQRAGHASRCEGAAFEASS